MSKVKADLKRGDGEGEGGQGGAGAGSSCIGGGDKGYGEFADSNDVGVGGTELDGDGTPLLVLKGKAQSFGELRKKSEDTLLGERPPPPPSGLIWEQPRPKAIRKRRRTSYLRLKRSRPPSDDMHSELADSDSARSQPSPSQSQSDGEIQTGELEGTPTVTPTEGCRTSPLTEMKVGEDEEEAVVTVDQLKEIFFSLATHCEPEPGQTVEEVVAIESSASVSEDGIREEDEKQFPLSSLGERETTSDSPNTTDAIPPPEEDLEKGDEEEEWDEEESTEASEDEYEEEEKQPLVYTCPFCEVEYREREKLIFHLLSHEMYRDIMHIPEKQQRKITIELEEENSPNVPVPSERPQPNPLGLPVANSRLYKMKNSETKLFMCRNCNSPFKSLMKLRTHVAREHDETFAWKCSHCDRRFLSMRQLKLHKRQAHPSTRRIRGRAANRKVLLSSGRNELNVTLSTIKLRPCKVLLARCDRSLDCKKSNVSRHKLKRNNVLPSLVRKESDVTPSTIKLRPCKVLLTRCDPLIPAHHQHQPNEASASVPVKRFEGTNFKNEKKRG